MFQRLAILLFACLVGLNYYPVFLGRVPLPADLIIQFPAFEKYQKALPLQTYQNIGDAVTQFYPWRKFMGDTIRQGILPLWNPKLLAGTPFQADPMAAIFYPLNWIFIVFPAPIAWSISLMLKVFLAAFFTTLYLREIGASRGGSIIGGMAFGFGGFMTAWLGWTHTDTALWLPLICLLTGRLERPTVRVSALLSVALAMPLLSGHPGVAAYVWVTAGSYALWTILWKRAPFWRQQIFWLLLAVGLSFGLAAVQLLPSNDWLGQIWRTLDVRWGPLPLRSAIAIFSRDLRSDPNSAGVPIPLGAMYAGALCLLGAMFSIFHRNRRDVIFFATLLIISFCSVYGIQPIMNLYDRTPVFKGLKKEEALLLLDFSLAVLAGLGVSLLEEFPWSEWVARKRAWLFATVIGATLVFHTGTAQLSKMTHARVDWLRSPRSFRVLLVTSAILILLRLLQLLSARKWIVLAGAVFALDMLSFSHGYYPFNRPSMIFPKAGVFDFLSNQQGPFRVVSLDAASMPNIEPVYGLSSAAGYDFMVKRLLPLTAGMTYDRLDSISFTADGILSSKHRVLDLLNVRYLIATRLNESRDRMRSAPHRFREVWSEDLVTVFENPSFLPRAFLVSQSQIEILPDENAQSARVRQPGFDPTRVVVLPAALEFTRVERSAFESSAAGTGVTAYEEGINWIRMQTQATAPSVLVLSQIYYPGWAAYVDDKKAPVLRTNYTFTGTVVDAGVHKVEFRFRPANFLLGAALSASSILLIGLVGLREWQKRKRASLLDGRGF